MRLSGKNQDEVIDGCIAGDRICQEAVYEAFYGKMMSVCLRYTRDSDEAKDILQEGFIKVFTKIEKFNRDGSFEGWVRRIVVNTAIDELRKKKNAKTVNESESDVLSNYGEEVEDPDEDESIYSVIKPQHIVEAMQQLSPAYQAVFNLYVMENYSHQEIAEELGISVGTSKSNLSKAKQNLKKILEREYLSKT